MTISAETVSALARAFASLIGSAMQVALFILMCLGLLLASAFLYRGLITGGEWVQVCGVLFGTCGISSAVVGREVVRQ